MIKEFIMTGALTCAELLVYTVEELSKVLSDFNDRGIVWSSTNNIARVFFFFLAHRHLLEESINLGYKCIQMSRTEK